MPGPACFSGEGLCPFLPSLSHSGVCRSWAPPRGLPVLGSDSVFSWKASTWLSSGLGSLALGRLCQREALSARALWCRRQVCREVGSGELGPTSPFFQRLAMQPPDSGVTDCSHFARQKWDGQSVTHDNMTTKPRLKPGHLARQGTGWVGREVSQVLTWVQRALELELDAVRGTSLSFTVGVDQIPSIVSKSIDYSWSF